MQSTQVNDLSTPSGDQIHHLLEKIRVSFELSGNELTRYSACKGAIAKVADALSPQAFAESAKLRDVATKINLSAVEWKDLSTYVSELLDTRYGTGYGTHFSNELMTAAQSDVLINDFMRNQFDVNEDATYLLISLLFLSSDASFKEFSSLDGSELRSYSGGLNANHSPSKASRSVQHKINMARELVELDQSSDSLSSHSHEYLDKEALSGGHSYQRQENETRDARAVSYHEHKLNRDKEDLSRDVDIQINRVPGRHTADSETRISTFEQRNTIVGDTSNPTASEPDFKDIRETANIITGILSGLDVELKDVYTFGKGIIDHDTAVEDIINFQEKVKPILEAVSVIPRANRLAKAMPTDVKKLVALNVALNTSPQTYQRMCKDYHELVEGAGQIVKITENPPPGVKAIIGALSEVQKCAEDFTEAALIAQGNLSLDNLTTYAKALENLYSNCEIVSKLITEGGQAEEELTSFRREVEGLSIAYGALSGQSYAWISDHPHYAEYLMGGNNPIVNQITTNSNVAGFVERQASAIRSFEANCKRFGISMHRGVKIIEDSDWRVTLDILTQTRSKLYDRAPAPLQEKLQEIASTFKEINIISNTLQSTGSIEEAKHLVTSCKNLQTYIKQVGEYYRFLLNARLLDNDMLYIFNVLAEAGAGFDRTLARDLNAFEANLNGFTTRMDNEIHEGVQEFETAIRNHYSWFGMVWNWFRNLF